MRRIVAGLIVAVGMVAFAGAAYADSLDFSAPTITPAGGGLFDWAYTLTIDNFEHINTAQNAAFATLYDVNGLVGSAATYVPSPGAIAGSATVQDVGITPATQLPTDNPAIPNITVTYTGTQPSTSTLGVLSFLDTQNGTNVTTGNFSAQATNNIDGTIDANTSSVPVPAPEPGTLALLAGGLMGLLGLTRRFR